MCLTCSFYTKMHTVTPVSLCTCFCAKKTMTLIRLVHFNTLFEVSFYVLCSSPFPWICQLGLARQYNMTPSEHKFRVPGGTAFSLPGS